MGSARLESIRMAYAILRTRKISTPGQMAGMQRHNARTNNVWNADPDLKHINETLSITRTNDLRTDIETKINKSDAKVKKNSVLAIEHLMTFSPDFISLEKVKRDGQFTLNGNVKQWNEFKKSSLKWLNERYGKENLVHVSVHYDEKTPHIHAYVVPLKEKTVKWKNKNGQGEKTVRSLSARDYLGGKEKMQEMQDSFHQAVTHLGLERGIKGSLAKHEHVQKYYARVNKSVELEQEMNNFKPSLSPVEIPKPPLFNQNQWREDIEQQINRLLQEQSTKAIEDFKHSFEGDFERLEEYRRLELKNKRVLGDLKNELTEKGSDLSKAKLRLSEVSKSFDKSKEYIESWKRVTKEALLGETQQQREEAKARIMNALYPQHKRDKSKGV